MGIQLSIKKKEKVIIEVIKGCIKSGIIITYKSCTLRKYISVNSDIIPPPLVLKGKIY